MVALLGMARYLAPRQSLKLPLHYNATPSIPRGFYGSVMRDTVRRGDLVRACVPMHAAHEALARGYLSPGPCPGGTTPLGKMVAGAPSDTVHVGQNGIRVGEGPVLDAPVLKRDALGRSVQGALGTWVLGAAECFVVSTLSPRSYDSRYFGPVACAPPVVILVPLSKVARTKVRAMRQLLSADE